MIDRPISILESVRDKADKKFIPLSVLVELTSRCNLTCGHCYLVKNSQRSETPTARIIRLIDELHRAGCLFLVLSGGEPLLHPALREICLKAHSAKMAVCLFTNGTLVSRGWAKQFAGLNIWDISLSIYGAGAPTHDRITGQNGSYQKTLKAAQILKDSGLSVRFKYIMMNGNIAEYNEMLKLAEQLDIHCDIDPVITPCDNGDLSPTRFRLNDEDLKRLYTVSFPYSPVPSPNADKSSCSFGRSHCAISAGGDVYPCIQLPVSAGNIRDKPFLEIWHHSPWLKEVREFNVNKIPECRSCVLSRYCRFCPGLAYLEDGSIYRPSREACRHAKIIGELLMFD